MKRQHCRTTTAPTVTGNVTHFINRGKCTASWIVFRVQVRSNGRSDSFGEMSSRRKGECKRERGKKGPMKNEDGLKFLPSEV